MDQLITRPELLGHLAFLLLAVAFLSAEGYWLRVFAALGFLAAALYFHASGTFGLAGIVWSLALVAFNLAKLLLLLREQNAVRLPASETALLRRVFHGLPDVDIARLLRAGEIQSMPAGSTLARQDAPLAEMFFLLEGRASVAVNKSFVTYLEPGSFIGEIAYLTGNPATADVTVDEDSRLLVFNKIKMAKIMAADEHLSGVLHQVLGKDLAMKMRRTNTRRVLASQVEDPTL
jgi:CRP-like cAMP-binding protein